MEEAKGQSILDKMLTTFINTLVKAAENEAQTHFGKNLEEVLKHFMAKVNSDFEKQCLLWYFTKKGQTMTVSSEGGCCLACGKREAVSWPTEGNH